MNSSTEQRHFRMHSKLLLDVIRRQAGTLSKAILEGVMNAVDAKATVCKIRLAKDELKISDDGQGFKSRENITTFFESFGEPHDESEGKIYGTFRMGRGQLFSFGINAWRTGKWQMLVDIAGRGLEYDLTDMPKNATGCSILVNLYEPIGLTGVAEVRRDIEKWCKYAPIDLYFNEEKVNVDPKTEKWTTITDEAYIRLNKAGSLSVYNLGVHTMEIGNYKFGTGGEVVSRKQLKVNFARNDVQADCPVWRKIKPKIDQLATDKNTKAKSLDDDARQRLADQLRRGEIEAYGMRDKGLFTMVTGRQFSAKEVMDCYKWLCYSVCAKGDRLGDMIMRRGISLVFADETLTRFGFKTVPELLRWIKSKFAADYEQDACKKPFKTYEELAKGLKSSYTILDEKELTPTEKLWLQLLEAKAGHINVEDNKVYGWSCGRRLMIGITDAARGWTDGETYVAINRSFLQQNTMDIKGITTVGHVLIHEACHHDPDTEEHDHDQAFYERYHDATGVSMGEFVESCVEFLPKLSNRLSRKLMSTVDQADAAKRAGQKMQDVDGKIAAHN